MANKIFADPDDIAAFIKKIRDKLLSGKWCGEINIKEKFGADKRTANLYISPIAYTKMFALVNDFTTEVEWHGLIQRIDESEFELYDILVFPHEVGSATVTSNQEEYEKWLDTIDDTTFNNMKFHGHSHVNMGVTPSGVDESYRESIVSQLPNDSTKDVFYAFMIVNKKHEIQATIYDVTENAVYDTRNKDLVVDTMFGDGVMLSDFVAAAKKIAVPAKTIAEHSPTYYGSSYKYADNKEKKKKEKSEDDEWFENYYKNLCKGGGWYD